MGSKLKNTNFIYDLFNKLQEQNIEYIFRGNFDNNITDGILSLAEVNLNSHEASTNLKKRVFYILVEGLQNITRHQKQNKVLSSFNQGFFVFQQLQNQFIITTGNLVNNKDIKSLKEKLDKINKLSVDELRKYYKTILNNETFSEKGGAGLGLIEIARKSESKLNFDFLKISDTHSFFYLQTFISKDNEQAPIDNLQKIKEIHKIFIENDLIFNVTGLFNHDKVVYIISLLESNISKQVIVKRSVFGILIEILQNIVTHGYENELKNIRGKHGIVLISDNNEHISLMSGNFVNKDKIETIDKTFGNVNNKTFKELAKLHFKTLFQYKNKTGNLSSLGLIDMRIKSKSKIDYSFAEYNDKCDFFTVKVDIQKQNNILKRFELKETENTPAIILDREEGTFLFEGACFPENPAEFFSPVIAWLNKYGSNPRLFTLIIFKFSYLNTSSQKTLVKVLDEISAISKKGSLIVRWNYFTDDDERLGLEFSKLYEDITFEFEPVEES